MLMAQESGDVARVYLLDTRTWIAIEVAAFFFLVLLVLVVLLLRHLRFSREKQHTERLKMIEMGYPLEEAESTKRQQKYLHNAFWISFWMVFLVPSAAFSAAVAATESVQQSAYLIVIWIGASVASVAAVVCAAVLMMYAWSTRESEDERQVPPRQPKPLDR